MPKGTVFHEIELTSRKHRDQYDLLLMLNLKRGVVERFVKSNLLTATLNI